MPKAKKIKLHHKKLDRSHEVETEQAAALYEKAGWERVQEGAPPETQPEPQAPPKPAAKTREGDN